MTLCERVDNLIKKPEKIAFINLLQELESDSSL